MTRIFAYIRQSKTDDDESRSLPAQERAIRDYCEREGLTLIEVYREPDQSAKVESIAKRPVFKRMLDAVARRESDAVIVHELSRWSCNIGVSAQAFRILDNAGATLISVNDAIDRTTASGRLFTNMMSAIHEFYSENLGEHMEKATSERLHKGLHVG